MTRFLHGAYLHQLKIPFSRVWFVDARGTWITLVIASAGVIPARTSIGRQNGDRCGTLGWMIVAIARFAVAPAMLMTLVIAYAGVTPARI